MALHFRNVVVMQAIEEYERKLEEDKKSKPAETIIVDTQVADIFKQRRENVEKHVFENEPNASEESSSDTHTAAPHVLRDSNQKVKVTQVMPQVTQVRSTAVFEQPRKDVSPKHSLSKSTPDIHAELQTSVTSFSVTPLRMDVSQAPQVSRVKQLQRSGSTGTPPASAEPGKENIQPQPQLRKAKTFDSGQSYMTSCETSTMLDQK